MIGEDFNGANILYKFVVHRKKKNKNKKITYRIQFIPVDFSKDKLSWLHDMSFDIWSTIT